MARIKKLEEEIAELQKQVAEKDFTSDFKNLSLKEQPLSEDSYAAVTKHKPKALRDSKKAKGVSILQPEDSRRNVTGQVVEPKPVQRSAN